MAEGEAGFHGKKHAWQSGVKSSSGKSESASSATPPAQPPTQRCPSCASQRIWKDGLRQTRNGDVQRYICRECGYRFSEKPWKGSDPPEHVQKIHRIPFYSDPTIRYNRQVCVTETRGAKNLAEVESRTEKRAAGATKPTIEEIRGAIVKYMVFLDNEGYRPSTIEARIQHLWSLTKRGANIFDPNSVKETLAKQHDWSDGYKEQIVYTYIPFATMINVVFDPPRYQRTEKYPFISTEAEIDQLIAACGKKTGAFLQTLKETGARCGEIWQLKWTDYDNVNNTLSITPEKNGKPRILKISTKLVAMLNNLQKKDERIFGYTFLKGFRRRFDLTKRALAHRWGNPRILQIHFHTLRHWKATMLYHQTKDIVYVKEFLGHKSITNTLRYIQLEAAAFGGTPDQYISKVANTIDEARQLIEAGFDYVTEMDGVKLFRKRK